MKQFLSIAFLTIVLALSANSQTLVHYWNFNDPTNEGTLLTPQSLLQGASITHIQGGLSAIDVAGGTGQNFNVENLNARNGDASGNHLRFNNPIGGTLIFALPTTGFKDVAVKFATRRSGSGAGTQIWEYTTDGTNYTEIVRINPNDGNPTLQTINFADISASDDNANFKLKVTFIQGPGGTVGNNRFDNFTLDGVSNAGDTFPPVATFNPLTGAKYLEPTINPTITFNEKIRLINDDDEINNSNVATTLVLKMNDMNGTDVPFTATYSNKVITVIPTNPLVYGKTYYLAIKPDMIEDLSDNAITNSPSTLFTIIPPQTQFSAGDLVLVAYRMNATGADDEIAVLTTVNILPETRINFTDKKYTTNNPAQCAGGFIWTAPESGLASGTVITIGTDDGITNYGTISGSTFGLSSNGDQVIVYTGTIDNPNYVTAMSSNAWIADNVNCSGSLSMIPSGLQDGVSAINLSTAPGNESNNTVNAYYAGPQNLQKQQLIQSILNPANWIGIGEDTPAQVWPAWTFAGPPSVINAMVINQTTIKLTFSTKLDNTSALDPNNYIGISNLNTVNLIPGANNDEVILNYSSNFPIGIEQNLLINNVKNLELVPMFAPYTFTFTYQTRISFDDSFVVVEEGEDDYNLIINVEYPAETSVDLVFKAAPFSTASQNDIIFQNQTINLTGQSSATIELNIPILEDFLTENDEYFVLYLENENGLEIEGDRFITVYIRDNDREIEPKTDELYLNYVSSFLPNNSGVASAEIISYDPNSKRLFATSAIQNKLDIVDISNPSNPINIKSIDMTPYGGITSVSAKNGVVAVASPNANEQLNGSVVFFDTDGNFLNQVTVGALPDMITFTKDGKKVITANEGQPSGNYSVDPEGSVSIIDMTPGATNLTQQNVSTLLFTEYNANEQQYIDAGVRKLKLSSTLSQDLEPEYIAVSDDSKKAWVIIQENNAVAEINLTNNTYTSLWALGTKDMMAKGNGFDASDNNGEVLISNWNVKSFYIPDATAYYNYNGVNYLISTNEGDEKEYDGLEERTTVGNNSYILDPMAYPNAEVLKKSFNLGRFRVTNLNGDDNGDGKFEQIYSLGARSFTIWNADTKQKVWDSGNEIEQITSKLPLYKDIFNADNEGEPKLKARSRAKGPEPEAVTLANINGQTYAFIGLERTGGVMVYNVTNPNKPYFVDYHNSRIFTNNGDLAPESIYYINANESPNGKNLVLVAHEISGTIAMYEVVAAPQVNLVDKTTCKKTNVELGNIVNGMDLTVVNGSGDYTYNWSPSSSLLNKYTSNPTRVNAISTTTYTLTVKDNVTGKTASGTMKLTVNNQPYLSLPLIYQHPKNTALDLNDLIANISGGTAPYSVIWSDNNGNIEDPTNVFPAIGMNRYFAIAIDANGCSSVQKKVSVYVSPRKESQEFEISDNGSISLATYPNPTVNNLNVIVNLSDEESATLKIMDMSGKTVISTNINTANFDNQIDVSNLSSGAYFVIIETETSSLMSKFIKE